MHSAAESLRLLGACEISKNNYRPLSHVEAATLSAALDDDGRNVAQIAFASFADALLAINGRRYTWATIKLYYTVFYALSAISMLEGTSVFYKGTSPFSILSKPGELFKRKKGNSHSIVFENFRIKSKNDILLSQPIGLADDALEWIENLRNIASYKTAPFPDPHPGQYFYNVSQKLRLNVGSYFNDDVPVYAFQEDHAIVAFPILSLKRIDQELKKRSLKVEINAHYTSMINNSGCDVSFLKTLNAYSVI